MGSKNFFLKKEQYISDLFNSQTFKKNIKIKNIKPLGEASKNDLTFYDFEYLKASCVKLMKLFILSYTHPVPYFPTAAYSS